MQTPGVGLSLTETPTRFHLRAGEQWILAIASVFAGIAPFAAHWIPNDVTRFVCGVLLAAVYLALTLYVRTSSALRQFWELSFAFFVLATVLVLNDSIPGYVGTYIPLTLGESDGSDGRVEAKRNSGMWDNHSADGQAG
jgi:hypothetical protein